MKCTQYGICEEVAFKNARAMDFRKSGTMGRSFPSGPENPGFFVAPARIYLPRKARSGLGYCPPSLPALNTHEMILLAYKSNKFMSLDLFYKLVLPH